MPNTLVNKEIDRICEMYARGVRGTRVRRIELLGRKCNARIIHTLLGYELVLGRKRLTCPDMITARYLRLFGQTGMRNILIPYNPVETARILPALEAAFARLSSLIKESTHPSKALTAAFRKLRVCLARTDSPTEMA
jgi:hypothetical protein